MSKRRIAFCTALAAGLALLPRSGAEAITSIRIATGLVAPIYLVSPDADTRLFVVSQSGTVTILRPNGDVIGTFLDIRSKVAFGGERGLFSIAFPDDYDTTGEFYVNYTGNGGDTVVERYRVSADPDVADPATGEVILGIVQPQANHNGGRMMFGPDGFLYIATGDGGGAADPPNNAQNKGVLLGKVLRVDVSGGPGTTYTIPNDNPFVGELGTREEIWAYGLRNPWGFTFDTTGDLYIADVGQDAFEEVNVQPAASAGGENYGWRLMEGKSCHIPPTLCNDGSLKLPIHDYPHQGTSHCSITGGFVYRGAVPEIQGHYFFADFCSWQIWTLVWDGAGGTTEVVSRTSELVPDQGTIGNIAGFGRDTFGNVFILDAEGEVFKIVGSALNLPDVEAQTKFLSVGAPNPFRTETRVELDLGPSERAHVVIVDVRGRLVRRLGRSVAAGVLSWDGRDDRGRRVAPGTYLVRADAGARTAEARVTLLR